MVARSHYFHFLNIIFASDSFYLVSIAYYYYIAATADCNVVKASFKEATFKQVP